MTDIMTPAQRHYCMSRIRSNDTKPEMIVRRFLWSHGIRYRLHRKGLPGKPDIVIMRLRTVIFINGCFWHGHDCREYRPKTNTDFWTSKIERNRRRDLDNGIKLRNAGYNVITIWECELSRSRRSDTLERLLATLKAFEKVPARKSQVPAVYSYPGEEYTPEVAEPGENVYE